MRDSKAYLKLFLLFSFLVPVVLSGQHRPKMYLGFMAGGDFTRIQYKDILYSTYFPNDFHSGGHIGFFFRVKKHGYYGEVGLNFITDAYNESYNFEDNPFYDPVNRENNLVEIVVDGKPVNKDTAVLSTIYLLEIPLLAGRYIINKAWFKFRGYTGFDLRFQRGLEDENGIKLESLDVQIPLVGMRFGLGAEMGLVNVDLNYSIGLNKMFRSSFRTQTHTIRLSVGVAL